MITVMMWSSAAYAGAWTRELGSTYVKAGADVYQALSFQAPGESERSDGAYVGQQYSVYGEFGVSPGHPVQIAIQAPILTVGVHNTEVFDAFGELPVRALTVRSGDFRAWAQTAITRQFPLAAALEAKIPMYENDGVGEDLQNLADLFPKPGDGQVDITAWIYGGSGISDRTFVEGGVGYMFRTEAFIGWETDIVFNDGPRFLGKIGTQQGIALLILGIEGQFAWSNQTANGEIDTFTREFLVASGNALFDLGGGFALEPRVAFELYARNASQGFGGGIGVSWRN